MELQNFHRTTEVGEDLWRLLSPGTLFKAGSAIGQDAQDIVQLGLESEKQESTVNLFFITKHLLFHCLMSFQWAALRRVLPVLIPPYQVFMYIDQIPLGFLFDQDTNPSSLSLLFLSITSTALHGLIPVNPRQVHTGNPSAAGVASLVLSRGAG